MKMLTDFLPVILFFVVFKVKDIYWATGVAIAATLVQVGLTWALKRKVETMQLVTLVLMVVLGSATILLRDERFVKWKPSLVNWGFGVAFLVTQWWGAQPLIQRMVGQAMTLPEALWRRLNLAWAVFFFATGALNLLVAYRCSTDTWVNFKLFGLLGLTVLFALGQAVWLSRHQPADEPPAEPPAT